MSSMTVVVVGVLVVLACVHHINALAVNIDAHDEICFQETVVSGTKLALTFQVAEGGFLDIDVSIIGPDSKVIYNGNRETDGKYTFAAPLSGKYKYCFSNKMSSLTPKLVVFDMLVGTGNHPTVEPEDEHSKINEMILELATGLEGVKREQEYMEVRERTHRMINDNTNSRVVWWSFFEAVLLVIMALGQVYYLNRFFEVRAKV